jgi:hypothetical protein
LLNGCAVDRQARTARRDDYPPKQSMFTPKACTATCVLDGMPVTLTYYPDTTLLRITDASGRCMRETRWPAPWRTLLATLREFSGSEVRDQLSTLLDEVTTDAPRTARRADSALAA